MTEQSRINAMIAYFFLGPLFLLVSKEAPIGEPYVRAHAKRASIIMVLGILIIGFYIFVLKSLLDFQIFGISLHSVLLASMMSVLSLFLIHGAYRAYHGVTAGALREFALNTENERIQGTFSEEDKIRILASFLPFVGIFIAKRYPTEPYLTGRKVGNLIAFSLITSIVLGGSVSNLTFVTTLVAIAVFAITGAYLFFYDTFLSLGVYRYIPTYASIEAHIATVGLSIYDFFRVAFGGSKTSTYQDTYTAKHALYTTVTPPVEPYILPTTVIGFPVINLVTLPSLFMERSHAYRGVVLQGIIVTVMLGLIIFLYSMSSPIALYLLFPIVTLLVHAGSSTSLRAPIVSPIMSLISLFTRGQARVAEMGEKKEEVSFKYEER